MDFLKIPLRINHGQFERVPENEAYSRYVELFFSSRKYETASGLAFGLDLDDHPWVNPAEYIRIMVEDFNRYHAGKMTLKIESLAQGGTGAAVALSLRTGGKKFPVRIPPGGFTGM